ncbi:MAG: alpha-2-macroglobulin [Clostridia bacterium]|nr:alpha-2-macroglobulin [Clostridia bacterium]
MGKKYYLLLALLVVFLGIFVYWANIPEKVVPEAMASEISMLPTKHDSAGVDLDTEFVLQAEGGLDPNFIAENLKVEPAVGFTVKKGGEDLKKAIVTLKDPLEPQKVYKFSLNLKDRPLQWAFQTKGDFKVISTLPRNRSTGVPLDTGIEITFSHLNVAKLPEYFSIEPEVEGKFEIHKKPAVFIPKKLNPATVYTVTVKKGLPLLDSTQTLAQDYVFQFETKKEKEDTNAYLNIFDNYFGFTAEEKPYFQFFYHSQRTPEGKIAVYSYKSAEEYIKAIENREKIPYWAYYGRLDYREDTSGLAKVADYSVPLKEYEDISFYELPEPLPAGYYLAEISLMDASRQVWFQVTDLGIYAAASENKTLFWVNDLTKGLPVADAEVQIIGGEKAKTDINGLAEVTGPPDASNGVRAVISKGNLEAVAFILPNYYIDLQWEASYNFQNSFWRYLYLDRTLYKPNDTVHFWGLVKPRTGEFKKPSKVTVALTKGVGDEDPVIVAQEIPVADFHFTGSLNLPNLLPGYYYLTVKIDGQALISQGLEVDNYSKPAYQIEASPQRKAVFAGEKVDFQVKASFFEGTAAANMPINFHIYNQNGRITTNAQGQGIISYTPSYEPRAYSQSDLRYLYLTASLPEAGDISGEAAVWVLNNDLSIETQAKAGGGTAQVRLEVNKLTLDKVNSGAVDPWEPDAFKDKPAANHEIKVKVFEEVWEKREIGQYYDFINKKVMPRYYYEYKKIPYLEDSLITGGDGKAIYTFPINEKSSYVLEFTAQDFRGKTAFKEARVYGSGFYLEQDYSWYHLETEKPSGKYGLGEEVVIQFKKNEAPLSPREKGFLFFTCRNGVLKGKIQDTATFTDVFTQEQIPNYWVKGVYFDGRYYYQTAEQPVCFDEEEKALKIEITTDKEEYRPGDTVKVDLTVKNSENKPVRATVNLNLVDEALYALRDYKPDLLRTLYAPNIQPGIKGTLISHKPADPRLGGAEKGGEGGGERRDFKDTVLFKTITTDGSGKASVEFQVPDNLTSWRLTCQAVTEDLAGATAAAKVKVKLPFFVDMVLAKVYLTGDEVTVPIRSYGSRLKEGSKVEYELALKSGEKVIKRETVTGQAFQVQGVALPPLAKGDYDLTLTGKTEDGLTDTLTLSFQVADSLVSQKQTEFFSLTNKIKLKEAGSSPVTLIFADYERSQYLDLLWRLSMASGARIEQRMAPHIGQKLINQYFPDIFWGQGEEEPDYLSYQTPEGGIGILPYSDADLELSVKLAALKPEAFDINRLAQYFANIANDPKESRERAIMALAGLACLNEPVLQELAIVAQNQDLSVKEQLYLNLALMELGDAKKAADNLALLLKTYSEELGPNLRLKVGTDQDDILEATQMAAVLAMGLDLTEEAAKLQGYVLENRTKDILLFVEQLMYLEKALPKLKDKPVGFTYKLDGETKEVALSPHKCFSLMLTAEKIEKIEFTNIDGVVGVTALYEVPFKPPEELSKDGVKISRQYEVNGKPVREWGVNDLVRIKISYQFGPQAPDGPYEVSDFLPAGLKIVRRPYYRGVDDLFLGYPVMVNGQKATFLINGKKDGYFTYYARVVNPGKFKAEQAILTHGKSGVIYGVSPKDEVSIK